VFESNTNLKLHNEMLQDISNEYDKTSGEFIYDATRPAAIKFEKAYKDLDIVVDMFDLENLTGQELEKRIRQRTGQTRKEATFSNGIVRVKGNGIVSINDLFETEGGIQFRPIETITIVGEGFVNIQCTIAGTIGNVPSNQIRYIPITIAGITEVTNLEPTKDGFEAESDKELLQRYYERIQTPATSGNKAHYKNWAKEVLGVGDAKVFPLWNGDNTVKVVVIDANKQPASVELVETVQNYIDPNISGLGKGEAPIGAFCTIASALGKEVNIGFTAVKDSAYTNEQILDNVRSKIVQYFKDIAFVEDYVSYAIIGSLILQSEGVQDYSSLTVNGGTSNITIENEEVAVLGEVVISG